MIKLSYSRWSAYRSCPYSLILEKKHKSEIDQRIFIPGRVVHALAEEWPGEEGWMVENAWEFLSAELEKSGLDESGALRKVKSLAGKLEPVLAELYESGEWKREEWISTEIGGVELRGIMDIWGDKTIYDIKTGRDEKWLKVEQLEFYGFILRRNGVDVENGCFITPAMERKLHYHRLYPWRMERIGALVGEVVKDMAADKYEPTPGVACHSCFYKNWCGHRRMP